MGVAIPRTQYPKAKTGEENEEECIGAGTATLDKHRPITR